MDSFPDSQSENDLQYDFRVPELTYPVPGNVTAAFVVRVEGSKTELGNQSSKGPVTKH